MCRNVEDGGVTILRIRQLLNYPQPAVSAHRSLENFAAIFKFMFFLGLATDFRQLLYSYMIVERKSYIMKLFGSPTDFSVALFCHVGEA